MIKLHSTRLMRSGEVAFWLNGAIVWSGTLGAQLSDIDFDTVSLHVDDSKQLAANISSPATADAVLTAVANWWC